MLVQKRKCDHGTFCRYRHHLPKLEELALANCGTVEKREVLRQHLAALDAAELTTLVCRQLRCIPLCSRLRNLGLVTDGAPPLRPSAMAVITHVPSATMLFTKR